MVTIGAVAEPLVVVALLIVGTWINRDFEPGRRRKNPDVRRLSADADLETARLIISLEVGGVRQDDRARRLASPSLLPLDEPAWRKRRLGIWGLGLEVEAPHTRRFKGYIVSRLLERFPFLVECWYWALIYWVYQLGRAASAIWIAQGTISAAREHALEVIVAEQRLEIFWELGIQKFFMGNVILMTWTNRTYSFIHIPGSIAFLVWLFYCAHTRSRVVGIQGDESVQPARRSAAGPGLYESRRRTMALCNLLAFIVFTLWPCMPPRLLSADTADDELGKLARSYGFIDTVHGPHGEGSIWTDNRFTNKFAAMPSLHFGYSLLIGCTIATIPLNIAQNQSTSFILPFFNRSHPKLAPKLTLPSWHRVFCVLVGALYPSIILIAIIATANHFILDAVAGACICGIAWYGNNVMLNLLVLEDWFLWFLKIHKPEKMVLQLERD